MRRRVEEILLLWVWGFVVLDDYRMRWEERSGGVSSEDKKWGEGEGEGGGRKGYGEREGVKVDGSGKCVM
jgi:hypothetical protein